MRDLALLAAAAQRWPDADAARRARGALYRRIALAAATCTDAHALDSALPHLRAAAAAAAGERASASPASAASAAVARRLRAVSGRRGGDSQRRRVWRYASLLF